MTILALDDTKSPATIEARKHGLAALTLGALGVVYGDIGTSPLYTMKEVFHHGTGVALDAHNIIGAVSTIFWAIMLVVTLKYVVLILRADNRGEGGGLALTALATKAVKDHKLLQRALLLLGVAGATLFFADGIITPAITVFGAVEGLQLAAPSLGPYVVPITAGILVGLFCMQRFGTAFIGRFFGPVIVVWFLTLAVAGVIQIAAQPAILAALNPVHAFVFVSERGWHVFAAIGAIVLALTGAEALYADMGHFGRTPIRLAWLGMVLPSLALNYLGQGALLMANPGAVDAPFFRMFPESMMLPVIALATLAAIIASQAVISGGYSMAKQAIQLGFLPRMAVRYTSSREMGQIYIPVVNWVLLAGVLVVVFAFGSSAALASAYGIAVTLTMLTTTILTYFVIQAGWGMPRSVSMAATAFFLVIDIVLVAGCAIKFVDGGWFPLVTGLLLFVVMSTWARGRKLLLESIHTEGVELAGFVDGLKDTSYGRAERTAVYPVADAAMVPNALLHNMKHNQVLHTRNIIVTAVFEDIPWVSEAERINVEELGQGFWRVTLHFGFMDVPDVPKALELCEQFGLEVPYFETSYFLSRETVVSTAGTGMARWREKLFIAMTRNAGSVAEYFCLPSNAVVELGTRVQI
ncbi:MAG: potassium transporter Kup [Pseudomonadota bacterium]